ncbi:MAG: AAA family ATPase [Chloroflexi bacterium]|nr:AAA family ATPase [Chloroflexota bacterium]
MICATCGTENRPGRKFCASCGAALALGCPSCGALNVAGERFCGECGKALSDAGGAATPPGAGTTTESVAARAGDGPAAERRLVTVLFADLVGFTPFAEERDAEDVREVLTKYFALCTDVIERYGGTIEKFIGDAVMAVWGAPVAREDDAERAVRAGLELVDSVRVLGPGIQARCGILSGEAAVTIGAANQGIVAGDIVNTAARLQSVAPPGRVLVGEGTFRAAAKAIAFEEALDQVLKGKSSPVPAWLALRVMAERGGRGRTEGLEAPFVGRDDELRLLKDLFHAAAKERRARLVSVIGPGGIGKSRLAWEFEKYLDGIVTRAWWHHGRSPAYGQGISFWALGEMIRGRAGLAETDDEPTTRAKIADMLSRVVSDEQELRWIEPAMLTLLGISGGEMPADQLFSAWRTFFDRLALSGPVVLVFEDLHWADPGLLDFIDHLLEWSREQPIYVLTLARPELLERRQDWGAGRRNFLSLGLEPLTETAMLELLDGLVPGLPKSTAAAIVARADGMPLYAVETVRMLVADGRLRQEDGIYALVGDLTELAVPETLTALIGARLDVLDPADRALLQEAAVLGQSFTLAGLAAVSGRDASDLEPRLAGLVRREILSSRSDPRSPERGQYAFVQALIREVAYNTLTRRDRRERHLAAARFFEGLGLDELAGALAGHYLAAHANSPAGPEANALAIQARIALTGAADRASALGSPAQAYAFLEQALTIQVDAEHQPELLERTASEAMAAGRYDRAGELAGLAQAQFASRGDRLGEARVISLRTRSLASLLRTDEAKKILNETVPTFEDIAGSREHAGLLLRLANIHWIGEELEQAVDWADKALAEAERNDFVETIVDGLIVKGGSLGYLGRGYEGISTMRGAYALAEAHGNQVGMVRALTNLSDAQIARDPRAALTTAMAGLDQAKRLGRADYLPTLVLNATHPALRTGDWDWAVQMARDVESAAMGDVDRVAATAATLVIAAARGDDVTDRLAEVERVLGAGSDSQAQALVRDTQGSVAFVEGRLGQAYEDAMTAAAMISWSAPTSYLTAARAALRLRDPARARAALDGLDTTTHGPAISAAHAEIEAGLLALAGDIGAAGLRYRDVLGAWRDLGLPWDEALTAITMAVVVGPAGPGVESAARAARETFKRLGASALVAQLERVMAWPTGSAIAPETATDSERRSPAPTEDRVAPSN